MTMTLEERARKLRYEAERLAECLIAVLASVYSQKKSFAHPGDDISAKVTEIILEHDTQVQAEARLAALEEAADVGSAAAQAFIDDLDDKQILRAEDCAEKVATAIHALARAAAPATKEE